MSHTPKTTCLCSADPSACERLADAASDLGKKLAIARLALQYIREKLKVSAHARVEVEVIDLLCVGAAIETADDILVTSRLGNG